MRVVRQLGLLIVAGSYLTACGKTPKNASSSKDISSDINSDVVVMYWAQDASMFRGTCEKNKPLLRSYCQYDVVARKSADVSTALLGDSEEKHNQLKRDKTELTSQLKAIDDALRNDPTNPDLSDERGRVAVDLRKVTQDLAVVDQYYDLAKSFIDKIAKDTIVYKMNADNDRYAKLRSLVQALASIFNN